MSASQHNFPSQWDLHCLGRCPKECTYCHMDTEFEITDPSPREVTPEKDSPFFIPTASATRRTSTGYFLTPGALKTGPYATFSSFEEFDSAMKGLTVTTVGGPSPAPVHIDVTVSDVPGTRNLRIVIMDHASGAVIADEQLDASGKGTITFEDIRVS